MAQQRTDRCHVYVVDTALAKKAAEADEDAGAAAKAIKILGEFKPKIGEEELTTVHYSFPGTKWIVTASVFYTDESMASKKSQDSMQVGIVIAPNAAKDALSAPNNAVAETTYDASTDKVRIKKFLTVDGRSYLVGLECECNVAVDAAQPK
jgi:hypothetical protein